MVNSSADLTILTFTNYTSLTTNGGATQGYFVTPTPVTFQRNNISAFTPWANFAVAGTIYFPSTYTSATTWNVGLSPGILTGPRFGLGINYLNPTYLSIGDGYNGANWVTSPAPTIPIPAANSTHSFYLLYTPTSFVVYWDGQVIYQNFLGSNMPTYFWDINETNVVGGYMPLPGMVTTISLGTIATNWTSADTYSQISDTSISYTNVSGGTPPVSYISSLRSYNFCFFNCTLNFNAPTPSYAQFFGLQSTSAGQDYGFTFYTDGHLWTSTGGTLQVDLGAVSAGTPITIALELSSANVVFYQNGIVVYSAATVPAVYNATLQLQDSSILWVTNQNFGYLSGTPALSLWASWNNNYGSSGLWYDSSGGSVTDFSALPGGYAYLSPDTMNANALNNFVLTNMPVGYSPPVSGM